MRMSQNPAGTSLSFEKMMQVMVPKERCKFTFANVADDFGPTRTHIFDPPYDMTPGTKYSFWITDDGKPQLWQVEQRGNFDFYYVSECERVQPSDMH